MRDYVVYSGERGFWGKQAQWTSKLEEAQTFDLGKAIDFCRRRKGTSAMDGAISALPVHYDNAAAVLA